MSRPNSVNTFGDIKSPAFIEHGRRRERVKERFGDCPKLAQFDDGKEFYNVGVKALLEKHDIKYFSTLSDKKAAVVERFNRTLKTSMWKYFYSKGTYKWIDILDELVYNYNDTKHSTILMKPKDVYKGGNEDEVWTTLFIHMETYHYLNLGLMTLSKYQSTSLPSLKVMRLTLQKSFLR